MHIDIIWTDLKTLLALGGVTSSYISVESSYLIKANLDKFTCLTYVLKDGLADQLDFETNYKDTTILVDSGPNFTNEILVDQNSNTSGQKGPLIQGAVTTAAPSYTNAKISPLSLTTTGSLRVDNSSVTQPVSGTITANAGTNLNTSALALSSIQIDGTQKSIVRGGDKGSTTAADITSTNQSADRQALDVQIRTSSGVAIDSFGGGTQYADGTARGSATGTLAMGDDGTNIQSISVDSTGKLNINNISGTVSLPTNAATSTIQTDRTQKSQITDGTRDGTIKAASTAAGASDTSLVIALSPNSPIPTGSNVIGALTANQSVNVAQMNGVTVTMGNGVSGTGVQRVTLASDSTGQVALATGSNTIGALTANQSVNLAQIAGNTTSTGNGVVGTGVQRVAIASDNAAFSVNATGPTLTKGTQGSTGYSVQDLKDAGRVHVNYYAVAAAAGTSGTQTAITLTKSSGTSATSTAVSFVITSGKRYRMTHISFATRGHNTATAQTTTFNFRINTAGAVTTSSTPVVLSARSATPATANAWDRYVIPVAEGFEILGDGTLQFGITAAATYTTNAPTWDVVIMGYEY